MTQSATHGRGLPGLRVDAPAVTIESHGVGIAVRSNSDGALNALLERLPVGGRTSRVDIVDAGYEWHVSDPDEKGRCFHRISLRDRDYVATKEVAYTRNLSSAVARLVHDAEFRVAVHAPTMLFIHAASVAWRGKVIVLPGHTQAGKTTLTASLVRAGAVYFSDEYTVIDEDGLVHPFARPLHIRCRSGGRSRDVTVQELGGEPGISALPVGMIVAAKYQPGAAWRPRELSPGQAALALFDNAIAGRNRPAHTMTRIARALSRRFVAVAGTRGDADETAAKLLDYATRSFEPTLDSAAD